MAAEQTLQQQTSDLWDAVLNLALPAPDQLSILAAAGDVSAVDELALALDDVFWVARKAFEQGQLGQDELTALEALNTKLDEISGETNASLWTADALQNSPEWESIRQLAHTALAKRQLTRMHRASA